MCGCSCKNCGTILQNQGLIDLWNEVIRVITGFYRGSEGSCKICKRNLMSSERNWYDLYLSCVFIGLHGPLI